MANHHWTIGSAGQVARHFGLHLPAGRAPSEGWPLLCLLDGDWTWPILLEQEPGQLQDCAVLYSYYGAPLEHIQKARALDYTPPDRNGHIWPDPRVPSWQCGGAPAWLTVLQDQLARVLARHTQLNPANTFLFGHSYAGLFVLYAMTHAPWLVHHYICASPSVWWRAPLALDWLETDVFRRVPVGTQFTLIAGKEEKWYPQARDAQSPRHGGTSTLMLMHRLHERIQQNMPNSELICLEQAGHGQVLQRATLEALRLARRSTPPAS